MLVEFYNERMKKMNYDPNNIILDLSDAKIYGSLEPGNDYVCICDKENPISVEKVYELKSMLFEIRKIKDSAPFDNVRACSVRVIEYEEGREYPKVENVVVSGYFYNAYPEAIYDSKGFWGKGKDGKDVFYLTEREQVVSSSENSIKKYLSSVLAGSGIGKQVVGKLFNEFGFEILDKIKDNDPSLEKIIRKQEKREKLVSHVTRSADNESSLNFLLQNNISAEQAILIIKNLGSSSFYQLTNNPFVLLRFNSIPIEQVYKIAAASKIPFHCKSNLEGLLLRYIEYRKESFGDIYIEASDLYVQNGGMTRFESFYDKYNQYYKFKRNEIENAIESLIGFNRIAVRQDINDPSVQCIYEKSYFEKENVIVYKLLQYRRNRNANYIDPSVVRSVMEQLDMEDSSRFQLDQKQKEAVIKAMSNKISVISGGPGTGKTCVTKTIVDTFKTVFPSKKIQLCAPTGKASRRMSEVIEMPACTIHKKLGYGTEVDLRIEEDLLIVDECSMIDIDLFYKMLNSVGDNTSIVLVGDYNQLPSVGPGLILRDIVDSGVLPCTILENVFRQSGDSEIINAANHILQKRASLLNSDFGKDFVFIENDSSESVFQNISGCVDYLLSHGVDPDAIQILSPQNEGMVGTSGLNNMMRDLCNPAELRGKGRLINNTMFYPGDRIIETENDSDLGIFNGSIGKIMLIDQEGFLADFDGRKVVLTDADMRTVKLGYSVTVHKSQGSEFDYIFMPILKEHEYTLNKNLLYTAVTRAKKMFVLFGQADVLRNTVNKEIVWDRKSQIKGRLIAGAQADDVHFGTEIQSA